MLKNKRMSDSPEICKTSMPSFFKYGITGIAFAFSYRLNELKCNQILSHFLDSHKNLKTKKIKGYAAKITTYFGSYIEHLTGKKLTKTEFKKLALAGAITPIYDLFCDNKNMSKDDLNQLTFNPSELETNDTYLGLYSHMLLYLRKQITKIENFNSECERVMNAQFQSRLQSGDIDLKTIDKLTLEKGGASFLFWASTLDRSFDQAQKKLFFQLGGFVQIIDDIFDIAQDMEQGITTIATKWISNVEETEKKLNEYLSRNLQLINTLNISSKRKRKLIKLYYLLAVPAFIYLRRLQKESQKHELLSDNKTLKTRFIWTGWTPKYFLSMCHYLIKK